VRLSVSARELGTPEAAWLGCPDLARCVDMAWGTPRRVVVIAPHPDDEVLAVGGAMRRLGGELVIVAVTDGEASHPRSLTVTRAELAIRRAGERAQALAALGVTADVVRLGYADGQVDDGLAARLVPLLRRADWCLAPWQHDGHPDHDATGRAAARACANAGVELARYLVWAWHWAEPARLPWGRARRIRLSPEDVAAKRAAIAAYRSQITPLSPAPGDEAILPPAVRARFERPFELVLL